MQNFCVTCKLSYLIYNEQANGIYNGFVLPPFSRHAVPFFLVHQQTNKTKEYITTCLKFT